MLIDRDLEFVYNGKPGIPVAFIIDEDNLYDLALTEEQSLIFLDNDEILDISNEYPEHNGITVRFIKNGNVIEELKTTEYFGSILLSPHKVVNYMFHAYGRYAQPLKSKFINYDFVLIDRPEINEYSYKWFSSEFEPSDISIKCTKGSSMCRCGWNE